MEEPGNRDDSDRWQQHVDDRWLPRLQPRLYPNGRGWKTALAYLIALMCFPLFFLGLFWLMAGAPLP